MTQVIPAILTESFDEMREQIAHMVNLVPMVQIDICDGNFVPTKTWPMHPQDQSSVHRILEEEEGLPYWDNIEFEFDLMVANAHEKFELFSRLGAKRMVFHLEAEYDKVKFKEFLEGIDMYTRENTEFGLAINTTTSVSELKPFISYIDFVQVMGIENIGHQGEEFDERVLEQIKEIKKEYPEMAISCDGSVNENTAPLLVEAGVSRLVVGSALINSYDMRETIEFLENL